MGKYKVGDVAALFSKPKEPTTPGGKKLQSLFQEFYNDKKKFSQNEIPENNTSMENKVLEDQRMSKKNKKRKFSAVNDSQLNADDNSPKKFKKASEEQSPKNFGKKKVNVFKEQNFPRKKQKGPKSSSVNNFDNFPQAEANESSGYVFEPPTVSALTNDRKASKLSFNFIKKSKRQSCDAQNVSIGKNDNELSDKVPCTDFKKSNSKKLKKSKRKSFGAQNVSFDNNKVPQIGSFDSDDDSLRLEIQEFMKNDSKMPKKSKRKSFAQNVSSTNNDGELSDKVPLKDSFDRDEPSLKGQGSDFIRRPKKTFKLKNNYFGSDDVEKSVLFESENEDYVDNAKLCTKSKVNNNNQTQNPQVKSPIQKPPQVKSSNQKSPHLIKMSNSNVDSDETLSRTLFVGNLPPVNINKKMLANLFGEFGEIENIRYFGFETNRAKIFSEHAPKSLNANYAADSVPGFITFKNRQSAVDALILSGSMFKDHHITVDFAMPAGSTKIYDDKRSIFIGNLPFNVKDESIWNTFDDCGRIEGVRVVRDRATGIGKGFGYVLFATVESKEKALALEDVEINGRTIRIKPVAPPNKKHKQKSNSPVKRDTFKSRAISLKKKNETNGRKSIKKLMNREKTLHKKKKIASLLQKSMK